jgi:hypothetical protein
LDTGQEARGVVLSLWQDAGRSLQIGRLRYS